MLITERKFIIDLLFLEIYLENYDINCINYRVCIAKNDFARVRVGKSGDLF